MQRAPPPPSTSEPPRMPSPAPSSDPAGPSGRLEDETYLRSLLPLELIRSQLIPPAPNRRRSAIDWLPDFAGFSWIAYGASSFVVVSHCPSPLSPEELAVGPFLRQIIEPPPGDPADEARTVAWCPSRPSSGHLAAGIGRFVRIYSPCGGDGSGSLKWRQTACLSHSFLVEAIGWTGSGDGIVSAGWEVVLWKHDQTSWNVLHTLKADIPHALLSLTWSIYGPVATAAAISTSSYVKRDENFFPFSEASRRVLVGQKDGKSSFFTVDLWHPCSVSMIQWRPSSLTLSRKSILHQKRDVLLTCCLDGVVRFWSEIDGGRNRKSSKDAIDQKNIRRSYHVLAVIEVNHCLRCTLGADVFVSWAADIHAAISVDGDDNCSAVQNSNNSMVGCCEWLIAVGPGLSLTFWAIHLLDDMFPLRSPRVSLWKKYDLKDFNISQLCSFGSSNSDQSILINAVVSRKQLYGPPDMCSLLQLSNNNSVFWLHLRSPESNDLEGESIVFRSKEKNLSCALVGDQNQDGHEGTVLQIAVHPSSSEVEFAVSLDSHGILLFWSISTILPSVVGLEAVHIPSWQLLGRFDEKNTPNSPEYLNLAWIPSVLNGNMFLLVGHTEGIDCLIISDIRNKNIVCNRMFRISFSGLVMGNELYQIFVMPTSTSSAPFVSNKFLLIGIWKKEFRVLSWEIVMHSTDASGHTSGCISDASQLNSSSQFTFEHYDAGLTYYITADLFKSNFPSLSEQVTSFAVVPFDSLTPLVQMSTPSMALCRKPPLYHLATGFSNGNLTVWRINATDLPLENSVSECLVWEKVGMLTAHQGPVGMISVTNSGTNVASVCLNDQNAIFVLHIWGLSPLVSGGCFSLEHRMQINELVVALSWTELGNGQVFLGVCTQKELRVFTQPRILDMTVAQEKHRTPVWSCIALCCTSSVVKDFLWGPKLTPVLVHEKHFSLFSQWSFRADMMPNEELSVDNVNGFICLNGVKHEEDSILHLSSNPRNCNIGESSKFEQPVSSAHGAGLYNILKVCGRLAGSLPVYHSSALILYLYSGKLKRALMALQHLIDLALSNNQSATTTGRNSLESHYSCTPVISLSKYFEDLEGTGIENVNWNYDILANVSDPQYQRNTNFVWGSSSLANANGSIHRVSTETSVLSSIRETLESVQHIGFLNNLERKKLLAVVDLLVELGSQECYSTYRSFDEPGRRYWVAVRFKYLYFARNFGRSAVKDEIMADSWMIAWAHQSDFQDNLFNSVISSEPTWPEMRNMGVGYWFSDATQLRSRMEKLARSQYLLNKDPKDCALLYLALNRLQVLAGLFRISKDEKDKPLVGFLSRNFQEEKNKTAALKNAYVLLGRHQFELAAAFFLLGQDPSSAIMVCAKNLGDEQLALVICRLLEGCGGPLERQLISNFLLPNAISKGDNWLASLLEWILGNYSLSFKCLVDPFFGSESANLGEFHTHAAYIDPNIGKYSAMLASKNKMRNSIGEHMAKMLSKWSTSVTANALNRCGFPLEALECMSSWINRNEVKDQKIQTSFSDIEKLDILCGNLNHSSIERRNWLSGDVAVELEYCYILDTAMRYVSELVFEYPGWQPDDLVSPLVLQKELLAFEDGKLVEILNAKISSSISILHQKYSLRPLDIISRILVSSYSSGMLLPGYGFLHHYVLHSATDDKSDKLGSYLPPPWLLVKALKEICLFYNRYLIYRSFTNPLSGRIINENNSGHFYQWTTVNSFICSMRILKTFIRLYDHRMFKREVLLRTYVVLSHIELFFSFTSAWCGKNLRGLILLVNPVIGELKNESFHESIDGKIIDFLCQVLALVGLEDTDRNIFSSYGKCIQDGSGSPVLQFFNEKWLFIGASLLRLLYNFSRQHLDSLITDTVNLTGTDVLIELIPNHYAQLLETSLVYSSTMLRKHLLSLLFQNEDVGFPVSTILSLEGSSQAGHDGLHCSLNQGTTSNLRMTSDQDPLTMLRCLLEISLEADIWRSSLFWKTKCLSFGRQNPPWCWSDAHRSNESEVGKKVIFLMDNGLASTISSGNPNLLWRNQIVDKENSSITKGKDVNPCREATHFLAPKEVHKKSGELVEAMCFNCIDEREAVLASNRRGLVFFNWDQEVPTQKQEEYIWAHCDWPSDGCVEVESTSLQSSAPLGISSDSMKHASPGLSAAATVTNPLARPGRDLTGGGAFGIPGYAGIGASGFGWSLQEGLEELIDPPATVENISTRALSSHPSRPFFLVGSNTRIYLWEFKKEKATATYGALPVSTMPHLPALISALQFDRYGHRFANAAMDGIVSTWQLEVEGRSNVKPTESLRLFNDHACGIVYMSSSGSIVAASGHSTNNANIILWDTLAPSSTSQASIFCHEGGAQSLSVFNNGIGCGSTSPIIVTGGKNGDIGLHDFRYIATGRMKRHKHPPDQNVRSPSIAEADTGISKSSENVNGMLWYIEKAHLGTVTTISTIPNTSLFLSGSKDGDVKLWDAKRSELVFHWPKLHEKHTFFQSSSSGIVRAGLMDVLVLSGGFLTCGGDGTVKLIQLKDFPSWI